MDITDSLDSTFQHTHRVIAGVRPEQWDDATPCTDWTVRDLLDHMIGVVSGLGAAAAGAPREPFVLSADPVGQFDAASAAAMAAWRSPGVLERIVDGGAGPMPGQVLAGINLLDTATHSWDLAIRDRSAGATARRRGRRRPRGEPADHLARGAGRPLRARVHGARRRRPDRSVGGLPRPPPLSSRYLPCQLGVRFSAKARGPSMKSADPTISATAG